MSRTVLLMFVVLALALVAVAPAAAATSSACAPGLDLLAPNTEAVCKPAATSSAPPQPEFMTTLKVYHGHCRCSCSRTPDCNTSADCGGSACLAGITCC